MAVTFHHVLSCLFAQGLIRWIQDKDQPRGLEGCSSRQHAIRRQRHLLETKHAVFVEQYRQKNVTKTRDDERLAQTARRSSRKARNFASLLGQADAWVANKANSKGGEDEAENEDRQEDGVLQGNKADR